jgi:hypothetical protein
MGLRILTLLIIINVTLSQYSFAQIDSGFIFNAYKQNHKGLLEKNLLSHVVKDVEKHTDTSKNLNALINSFLFHYTQETRHGRGNDFQQDLSKETYIALQPKILVCFVDDLKHLKVPNTEKDDASMDLRFPHKNSINSPFLSMGYHNFPNERNCRQYNYEVDTVDKEKYIPVRLDSSFVKEVQAFLNGTLGKEHLNRKIFLKKFLKLTPSGKVEIEGSFRNEITFFAYAYLIDKIIFNQKMNEAEIQFSYSNRTFEAKFVKTNGKWIKAEVRIVTDT